MKAIKELQTNIDKLQKGAKQKGDAGNASKKVLKLSDELKLFKKNQIRQMKEVQTQLQDMHAILKEKGGATV